MTQYLCHDDFALKSGSEPTQQTLWFCPKRINSLVADFQDFNWRVLKQFHRVEDALGSCFASVYATEMRAEMSRMKMLAAKRCRTSASLLRPSS